jgi:molybdate transport system regulatory protein
VPDYPFITLRVVLGPETLLGAGKAELLAGIAETGSIAAASRRMGMSYKRAWYLIDTLNRYFCGPLVTSSKGGRGGGGAALTDTGRAVLDLYHRLQTNAAEAIKAELHELAALAEGAAQGVAFCGNRAI